MAPQSEFSRFFFLKIVPKEESCLFPLKMSPTLIWYFTRGLKPKRLLRSDRQTRYITTAGACALRVNNEVLQSYTQKFLFSVH